MRFNANELSQMSNYVRANALRAVASAGSGHVGIVMDAADIMTVLYANFLRRDIDTFVLSAGHGSALLYAVLKLSGYDIGDLNSFRKIGGLPGHPEYGIAGVAATTGPLGQGLANAVGRAMAEKIKHTRAMVYCLCSDGDLMEGVAQESIGLAGLYRLNNLVVLWDDNEISIDGTALTDIDVNMRMAAAGWDVITVRGDDVTELSMALARAQKSDAPTFIDCKTKIGAGLSVAGTPRAHGLAVGGDELISIAEKLESGDGKKLWERVARNGVAPASAPVARPLRTKEIKLPRAPDVASTRELSGMYLEKLLSAGVDLIGGSADLGENTNTYTGASRNIVPPKFVGNFINYGVREHAMAAVMNGLAGAGLRPYGGTFLVFSDYMRPAIRLAAMSGLPVIYVFTHDSVAVGQDGPTHEPVEQLASLRLIPNLNVFRPCNMAEVAAAWDMAIAETHRPSCIVLSRQKFRQVPTPAGADISRGAYVIWPATRAVRATIIATGAEVPLAIDVAKKLGPGVGVVSMPSVATFAAQDAEYRRQILRGRVIAIEAAARSPWYEFADAVVGVDEYGLSGPGDAVYGAMGFDADLIAHDIANKIK